MRTSIIAEPAIYWHGDFGLLLETAELAAKCGCDIFKLQYYDTRYLGSAWRKREPFYMNTQLSQSQIAEIKKFTDKLNMELLVTVNNPQLLELLREINVYNVKIASSQLEPAMIKEFAKYKWDKFFVSTGMLDDIRKLRLIRDVESKEYTVFHCVSLYPHDYAETNLLRLHTIRGFCQEIGLADVKIGYSDHAVDSLPALGSLFQGVDYLERHFKTSRSYGPTSDIACTADEMASICSLREKVSRILGDGSPKMQKREVESLNKYKTRWVI